MCLPNVVGLRRGLAAEDRVILIPQAANKQTMASMKVTATHATKTMDCPTGPVVQALMAAL